MGSAAIGLASSCAIIFEPILKITHPLLKYVGSVLDKYFSLGPNKKISSKQEMLTLLGEISKGSILTAQERKTIAGALTYADKKVREVLIPNSVVKNIKVSEELSPVVIGELHDSGHSRFPVVSDSGKEVLGTLFIKDAVGVKSNKKVSDVMRAEVYYLNEEQSLHDALKAFLKTKHHLFMVVNEYEDIVGIITIEDVIEQIIGEKIVDEFDQYDDLKAVAARLAEQKREERA
jgi:magnesium and cobalt transporter